MSAGELCKTRPVCNAIGVRKAPRPQGRAGYVRIDTVHQGDLDGIKGVYHITCVDEVCQGHVQARVQGISEAFLLPVFGLVISQFPFEVVGFHSDNGSEYINGRVAALLQKLLIEQTKSPSRHSNDNALADSKACAKTDLAAAQDMQLTKAALLASFNKTRKRA